MVSIHYIINENIIYDIIIHIMAVVGIIITMIFNNFK